MNYDYIIIGAGIVGVSTAWQLKKLLPDKSVLLLEKEDDYAKHQSGHNSGVIHAGVYYAPGTLKAKFCIEGAAATLDFCQKHDIPYQQCGKLLVACNDIEYQRMEVLFERCKLNKIDVEWLNSDKLKLHEPNISGLAGILVKATGIVDYSLVTKKMLEQFVDLGGEVRLQNEVIGMKEFADFIEVSISSPRGVQRLQTGYLISCSGLMSDRMARMLKINIDFQIIPYRGEYYQLDSKYSDIVNHLIYPIPDPDMPFLGVHLTRMIDGSVTVGPNAVQGWKREGYGRLNINLRDILSMVTFSGFWQVLRKNWKPGLKEIKNSWFKAAYLREVQKYCPQLELNDLKPYPAGVRAQAVLKDGTLVQDFLFAESPRSLHVCNAPSPAATSSIPIGSYICDKVLSKKF